MQAVGLRASEDLPEFAGPASCYAAGTRIATARGEVAVEALRVGDQAVALLAQGFASVRRIGSRTIDLRTHPAAENLRPVRIRAGAFGEGRPARDLVVGPGRALFVDGSLIPAERLLNGHSIVQEAWTSVTYWQVGLDRQDVLLAEGLAAASDIGAASHPDGVAAPLPGPGACAPLPLVTEGAPLETAKARLLARARTAFGATSTDDPCLHLLADGTALSPSVMEDRRHCFQLPAGVRSLRLASRVWVPAQLLSASTDARRLGVCVRRLLLDGQEMALDDHLLTEGWDKPEQDAAGAQRWTNGCAVLPGGVRTVEVQLDGFATYWAWPAPAAVVSAAA